MRAEYDFSGGVRGKHHLASKAGTNVVVLDPDVAEAFPDASSVNRALRLLLELANKQLFETFGVRAADRLKKT